jgi:hypothetical protein
LSVVKKITHDPQISVLLERLTSTIWLEELRDAVDCFSMDNVIGVGKMGMMYQGFLPNGQLLAVKRLFDSRLFKRQFLLETTILCKYRHKNIVPLLGFCIEGNERLLAYAYMSNGRLSKWLHPLESEVIRLKWHDRVNITLGIARGLSWLHHTCDLGIVHYLTLFSTFLSTLIPLFSPPSTSSSYFYFSLLLFLLLHYLPPL